MQRCRGGRHGSSCAVLTGQEGSGVGLKKRSDNQHVVGGGVCQGAGVGGARRPPGWTFLCSNEEAVAATF